MTTQYKIGTTLGGMATLASISVTDPQASPVAYAEYTELGNGLVRGSGWYVCEWRWARLYQSEVNALQAYCPGTSRDDIFIRTLNRGGSWNTYTGIVIWPRVEPAEASDCYFDFVITFRSLVEQAT